MPEQLERLRALLAAIVPGNRFYSARLAAAGVSPEISSLAEFTERLPFTTKSELVADQTENPPYGTNLTFPVEDYSRFCQTSGTSGTPLVILDDAASWSWLLGNWAEIYRGAGVQRGDRIYFAFSFGPFLGFWTAFEAATRLGLLSIPGGGLSTTGRLRAMIAQGATVLCCTPTYALHLAETARREGIELRESAIRAIIVAGEPGGAVPAIRERIRAEWHGADVVDHYGMTEVGPVTFQRPGEDVARVIEESYLAEIIDPVTGRPQIAGEVGELVLTTLGRVGAPLLRYRTGDLVRRAVAEPGFALAGGIIGRADDMVVIRGVNVYPAAIEAVVRRFPDVAEYRAEVVRQGALAELNIEIECLNQSTAIALAEEVHHALSLRVKVHCVAPGTLPRFELKARRWRVQPPVSG